MNRILTRAARFGAPIALLAALGGCGDSADALVDQAQASLDAQDYQAARVELGSALAKEPANPRALALMARVQLQIGDADAAEGMLDRLGRSGALPSDLARMKAEVAVLRGRYRQALAVLGSDATPAAWRIRAEAQLGLNDEAAAVRAFEQGMAAGADVPLATAYARYRLQSSDADGAARILIRLRQMAPDAYETLVLAGDLAAARGNVDAAIAAYARVVKAFPDRVAPMLALANQYDADGRLDEAVRLVDQAGKLAPGDPQVEALKYQFLSEQGEWEMIRLGLQSREGQLEPGSALQMTYAEALLRLGHAEQARLLFKRAALAMPGNPYSRMMLGEAQLAAGDPSGAWATLKPLAASTMARPEVLETAAAAAEAAGAPEAGALRARLDPVRIRKTAALLDRGEAALAGQHWEQALTIYEQLLAIGDDAEVLKRMAVATSRLRRADAAIAYADRAVALAPTNPDYLYLAGVVRLDAGMDLADARRLLEAASRADPRNPVIARDLRRAKAAG